MFIKLNFRGISHHLLLPVLSIMLVATIGGVVMVRASSAATYNDVCESYKVITYRPSQPYNSGTCIKNVQNRLIYYGYLPAKNSAGKSNIDGKFGPATNSAVRAFQIRNRLTPNGLGPATYRALMSKTALGIANTANNCSYTRYIYTDHSARPPVKPLGCASNSVKLRQYNADVKAYKIMLGAYSALGNKNNTTAAKSYLARNCASSTTTLQRSTAKDHTLAYGGAICVGKIQK